MPEFTVEWSIVVNAETKEEAVQICQGMLEDPDNTATYFRTINHDTGESTIEDYEQLLFPDRFPHPINKEDEDAAE
jgi:hypothetical protein